MTDETNDEPWITVGEFDSQGSAEVIRGLLKSEGVDSAIDPMALLLGIPAKFRLSVPKSMLHRARWILSDTDFTDRELDFLATGSLEPDED